MIKRMLMTYLKLNGWKFINHVPEDLRSFVMVGAPHTSNYDFIPGMAIAQIIKRNPRFLIKDNWLKFPLNLFFRPMGALGINRRKLGASYTDSIAQLFKEIPDLVLMVSPEATRSPNANWKTGFYYIAQKAGVPLVLAYADYEKKEGGLGKILYPTNFEADMKIIMDFYRTKSAKTPANFALDDKYK